MLFRNGPGVSARWILFLAATRIFAIEPLDVLDPHDAYIRDIGARIFRSDDDGRSLIDEAANHYASTRALPLTEALIFTHRRLAAFALEQTEWGNANGHYEKAMVLAQTAEDARQLIELTLGNAYAWERRNRRGRALENVRSAWDTACLIPDNDLRIRAGLALTELLQRANAPAEALRVYDTLLTLPDTDRLSLLYHRASNLESFQRSQSREWWVEVVELARTQNQEAIEARALDHLAMTYLREDRHAEGLSLIHQSDQLPRDRPRAPALWHAISEAHRGLGDPGAAHAAIERALAVVDFDAQPGVAADFEDDRATLLAALGNHAPAYAALRRAMELREIKTNANIRPTAVRVVPMVSTQEEGQAAALAAARAALREAELAQAQLRQRIALLAGIALLLLATSLAIAYAYKRRAAAAAADARDAAELRAERSHWQMLRYQLNPHFLFNALTSLSGLVLIDRDTTRRAIGRLSQFCRLAMERSHGELRTVKEEARLLSAYLDVERVCMGDRLTTTLNISPAAESWVLPPLLLQPLIENALKYGSQTSGDHLQISVQVQVAAANDALHVEVANTGTWIPPSPQPRRRDHIGLANVRERLARLSPQSCSLHTSTAAGWVRIRFQLPDLRDHDLLAIS